MSTYRELKGIKMAEKLKVIQVTESTHTMAKAQAERKGMILKAYIRKLVDKEEKTNG